MVPFRAALEQVDMWQVHLCNVFFRVQYGSYAPRVAERDACRALHARFPAHGA